MSLEKFLNSVEVDISYQEFTLKKKTINKPNLNLLLTQKRLVRFLKKPKVHKACCSYEENTSIKKACLVHLNKKYLLHVDIKDFFHSIKPTHLEKLYKTKEFNKLTRLTFLDNSLPIGSPTSPIISNRVMYQIDKKLNKIGLNYSRYADDLYFSSNKFIDKRILKDIEEILNENGFKINEQKTYFMHKRKSVLGILINDKKLSVGTSYKKHLKSEVYKLLKYQIGYPDIIRGKLAYIKFIEPNYYNIIKNKYQNIDTLKLFN